MSDDTETSRVPDATEPPTATPRKPRYTLEELLEGHDSSTPLSEEAIAWMNAPEVGRERYWLEEVDEF